MLFLVHEFYDSQVHVYIQLQVLHTVSYIQYNILYV